MRSGVRAQIAIGLRLHFRNKMALIYNYLFPTIFLVAFWVLYRYEQVPLARHMGELLTVSVLGGACFGLPTTIVSDRERGVWRRYRLTPVPTRTILAGTVVVRYITLITAGLVQLALAMAIGMPMPRHPVHLLGAFTLVSFAFIGLGLVIAMLADNVPAVQALGQCIFLPMLIIGGVAVRLSSLPDWAQHVSAFFPGRYAVQALQATVTGTGLGATGFSLLALTLIGAAGCLAAARLFRWDAQQRFAARDGKGWIAVAIAGWVIVGVLAEVRGHVRLLPTPTADSEPVPLPLNARTTPQPPSVIVPAPAPSEPPAPAGLSAAAPPSRASAAPGVRAPALSSRERAAAGRAASQAATPQAPEATAAAPTGPRAKSWEDVTLQDVETDWAFERLPPDGGIVTPIAPRSEDPEPDVADQVEMVRQELVNWKPAKVADEMQRIRNLLYVAAVPDVAQSPIERYVPNVVFDQIQQDIPKDRLIKLLYWLAWHPDEGDDSAMSQLQDLGIAIGPGDPQEARNRAAIYALKLLGRLVGKLPPKR